MFEVVRCANGVRQGELWQNSRRRGRFEPLSLKAERCGLVRLRQAIHPIADELSVRVCSHHVRWFYISPNSYQRQMGGFSLRAKHLVGTH